MNEVEYILRIVLKARDELATALKSAREELRLFANAAESNKSKIDGLNTSLDALDKKAGSITDKFREWRAVMQGTADGNADAKKSFAQLTTEVETSVKTTRKAATTMREYRQASSEANKEVKALYEAQKRGAVEWDFAAVRINKLGKELENLSLKFKSSSRDAERAFDWSRRAKEISKSIIAANDEITADAKIESEKRVKIAEAEHDAALKDLRDFFADQRKEVEKGHRINTQLGREEERENARRAQAEAQRHADALENAKRTSAEKLRIAREESAEQERIRQRDLAATVAARRAEAVQARVGSGRRGASIGDVTELKLVQAELRKVAASFDRGSQGERDFSIEGERVRRTLRTIERDASRTGSVFSSLGKVFSGNSNSVAGFDNQLRGIGMLAAVGFAQQLITVLGGLAGGFVAVASSAAQAGAAIGGTFVAGVGQALPAIGLLSAALFRVSAVMDVVKQAQLTQKQDAVQQAGASRRVADATDSVRTAQEGLANSQRQVREAQEGLTQARKDARRDLEDLIQAERAADLAARGAVLSQQEAQEQLRQAIAGGDVEGLARAELGVLEAQADAEEKLKDARRARVDAARGERGGVEGSEGVQNAKRSLEDAERAAAKASRGIATAQRNAQEAAAGTQTAAATLNYLLAQLSPAERRLYTALTNIQEAFKKTYRPITDLIIDSFTRSVKGVQDIMLMPEVISMARKTAGTIADSLNRIFDAFTSDKMIDQFLRIAEAGEKNLKPVTDIVIDLGKSLANIAEAAGPALTDLLEFVGDLVEDFLELTSQKGKMEDFFSTGEKHFEAWAELGLAVIDLFLALAGAGGAETGVQLVKDATKAIEGLVTMVHDNEDAVRDFFSDSRDIVHEVVGVVVALAKELFGAFTPERVENFATLLKEVVIPALGDVIAFLGDMTAKLVEFAETPFGERLLKGLVFFFILEKVIGGVLGVIKLFVTPIAKIADAFGRIAARTGLFEKLGTAFARMAPLLGRIALFSTGFLAIAGAVVFLLDQLGLLDEAWDAVKGGFKAFWDEVKPSLDKLVENVKDLWDAISDGEGLIAVLGDVFKVVGDILRPILRVVIGIGAVILQVFGRALGRIFGGAIDVLSGFFKILEGIIRLDFGMVWEGIKTILGGLFRMFTSLARVLPELFWEALKKLGPLAWDAVKAILRFFGRMVDRVWEIAKDVASAFGRGFRRIREIIRNVINNAWDWLKRLPGRFVDLAEDIVRGWGRIIRGLGRTIKNGIEDVWDWIKGLPKRLGDIAKDAAKMFVEGFKNVGKDVLKGITSGLREVGGFARDLANAFIDLFNALLPDKISVPGPDIPLPDRPIPHIQAGGPIGRGYGGGDKILGLLEAGEHVLTKEEVAAMGGHGAVYALRRALGGGGQGRGGRYAIGGAPEAAGADPGRITITFTSGDLDDFASQWREFWAGLVLRARRASNLINGEFLEMRVASTRQMQRMYRGVEGSLTDIQNRFKRRGDIIVDNWADMWLSLKKVTNDGLNYIGHETNRALIALGEKHINFGLTEPKKNDGKAGGGWIGNKGQRGRDRGFYPLGAGEAVLNWQHQKYVEPAMNAYYGHGLTDMFARTRGYHAGGPGQAGFAAGGFSPIPGYPGEEAATRIIPLLVKLMKQYHFIPTDVYDRDHSAGHKSPGHNVTGTALDAVPGPGGSWDSIEAMGRWAVSKGLTVGYGAGVPGSQNWPGHGRDNHIHIELGGNPSVGGAFLAEITKIAKPVVKGGGKLAELSQAAINMVLKAANATLSETMPAVGGETNFKLGPGGAAQKVFDFFTGRGLSDAIAAGFVGTFQKESNFVTTVKNAQGSGATGLAQWLGARLTALQAKPNWTSLQTQLNFVWEELHGAESAAFAAIKGARTPEEAATIIDSQYERSDNILNAPSNARQAYNRFHHTGKPRGEFAKGGEIPGSDSGPIPILAHAREWVLNPRQQRLIARMLGMSRNALKSVLGFGGGGAQHSFAAGGEVLHIGDSLGVGMAAALKKLVDGLVSDVRKGRFSDEAVDVLKKKLKASYREVIFDVGTNDAQADVLKRNLKRAYKLLGEDQEMVVSTVRGPNAGEKNEVIREFAKAHAENVRLVRAGRLPTGPDNVHLTQEGYRKRAGLFADAVDVKATSAKGPTGLERYSTEAMRKRIEDIAKGLYNLPVLPIESWQKVTKEARRAFRAIRAKGKDLTQDITTLNALANEGGIIEAMDAARERFVGRLARGLTRATFKFNRATRTVERGLNEVDVATRELTNLRKEFRQILGEEGVITKSLKKVNNRLRQLRRGGVEADETKEVAALVTLQSNLREKRRNIRDAHAEALARIFEAQVARQQAIVDEINSRYEQEAGGNDITRRIAEALGNEGIIAQVNNANRDMLARQAAELEARIGPARARGAGELADQLAAQVADLRTQIFESIQQELRDTMDRVNARASRRLSRIDLGGRMLDAIGAVGLGSVATVAGEQFSRGGMFAQRGAALATQRAELQGVLRGAEAQGNIALIQELTDQLAELDVTIQENTRAAFTARLEDVNARAGFGLNINDLTKQIVELDGQISGQVDQQRIANLLMERGNILTGQRQELEGLLREAQAAGDQQAINDLTIALLENEIATKQNTIAIDEANGLTKDPQTFTSTAWTRFREAIFNGMGQVLPQYDPSMMGGNAMAGVVTGAVIYPPVTGSTSVSGDTNITLNEVGRPVDLQEVSSVVTFASKTVQ